MPGEKKKPKSSLSQWPWVGVTVGRVKTKSALLADMITNRVKSADDSKDRSEKGSVANASALREPELAGVARVK